MNLATSRIRRHCRRRVYASARQALEVVFADRQHLGRRRSNAAKLLADAKALTDVTAKVVIYEAFVGFEAPQHLAHRVHDLYFEPKYEEFRSRTIWSLSNAFTSAFKELYTLQRPCLDSIFHRGGQGHGRRLWRRVLAETSSQVFSESNDCGARHQLGGGIGETGTALHRPSGPSNPVTLLRRGPMEPACIWGPEVKI